jgi:glycosyltransferase involved in cell wall biosynthesis
MPTISIIIPVYNTENYLRKCLDSIIAQSYTDFEAILVDDGSTDKSGEICDEYISKDQRFKVFHTENGGVSKARNIGLREAQGDWVFFVDSDDELYLDSLKTFSHFINDNIDYIVAGYTIINKDGSTSNNVAIVNELISKDTAIKQMFRPKYYNYLGFMCIKLFRMSVIRDCQLKLNPDIYYNEDRLFTVEFLCKMNKKAFFTTTPVYKIFVHPESAMGLIRRKFNLKYVTDFDATILMKKAIYNSNCSKINHWLVQICILFSRDQIMKMMKEQNIKNDEIKKHLHIEVKRNVSNLCRIIYFTKNKVKKLLRK